MYLPRIILLFFTFQCFWLSAQNPHPYFRNYTTDDGLPSSEVHYCIQDTAGYMWFATDNGLSRFDGYEFKNYGPREGLKHNVVFYMQQDPEGKIWLATMHGHLYYIDKDSIHAFAQNAVIEQTNIPSYFIRDFYINTDGTKYLSIPNHGILQFSSDGTFYSILPSRPETPVLAIQLRNRWMIGSQYVSDSLRQPFWNSVTQTYHNEPMEIMADSIYYMDSIHFNKRYISSGKWLMQLKNKQLLALSASILYEINGKNIAWRKNVPFDLELKSFTQDSKDRLLLGLHRGKGIRRYKNTDAFRFNNFEQFLDGISVSHIYEDRRGGYWISSIENGVFFCPDFDLKIYDQSAGFPNYHIVALDFKNESQVFIGFRDGQIILFDLLNNHIKKLPPISNNILNDLLFDQNRQELWATNNRPNILKNNKWINFLPPYNRQPILGKRLTLSRDRNLLWGGSHLGFGSMELNTKGSFFLSFDIGVRQRTFRVWEDQSHRIWVGNVDGFFELKNNQLVPPQTFHHAFSIRTEDIGELSDGTLVLATKGEGIVLWKEDYFHQITSSDGLTSDMLENVFVDEQNQIWAGTLEGLNKITRKGEAFLVEKYTTFHGLPSNEITRVTAHQGQVWVATTKGLVQWKKKEQSDLSTPPILEAILVNNEPYDFPEKSNLTYEQNDLEIHFLTINYNQNGKIPYRFRLNNDEWNYTRNRSVNFADLPPNDYQFEVQSQNENGVWSASNILNFQIRPAFWQTWWFILLSVSTAIGLVILIYRKRLQQVKREAQVEKEMNELQRAALRAQMNPHFIFNCLNSIQNFIVQNDSSNATRYLSKFAQLVRGTLNASMEERIPLQNEITMLENYLNLEKLRFKDKFNFTIQVDQQLDLFETTIPPLLTQPFVENAILHAFSENSKTGQIQIAFLKKNETLEINIQDNGIGIFESQQQKKSTESTTHKGVGMRISQKRLELADSLNEFEVSEIKDENGKVIGTLVKLVLGI